MVTFQSQINTFKNIVIKNSDNRNFAYQEWFIADHLLIVEKIAMELCDKYPEADREVVQALVWFHDFGKPIDEENEYEVTKTKGVEAMGEVGFPEEFIQKVLGFWLIMEKKNELDMAKQAIEVKIISTADGASHFVGKFYPSYFGDIPKESLESIQAKLKLKIDQDWNRKIVLPEVKEAFKERYNMAMEILGEYPEKFLL
jgi:putative nucleotidyltransferase with HDIG domain